MGAFRSHHERPSNRRSRSCQRQAEADRDEIIRQATEQQGYVDNSNKQEELFNAAGEICEDNAPGAGAVLPTATDLARAVSEQTNFDNLQQLVFEKSVVLAKFRTTITASIRT
jgi:hypothetical protein